MVSTAGEHKQWFGETSQSIDISASRDQIPFETTVNHQENHRAIIPHPSNRRRRLNLKPISEGNNRYGRNGKRRCGPCRAWKQKCEYEKIELPCKLCSERKLSCTVADKVWGETRRLKEATVAEQDRGRLEPLHDEIAVEIIPRQISVPSDQKLAPVEGAYLQHFFLGTDQPHKRFTTLSKCGFTLAQILRTRFAFQLGQGQLPKAIQYSLILLSTYDIWDFQPFITSNSRSANDPWLSNWVREIKSRFYECMIYAISKQDHLEIAYGCMGMCFYLFVANGEAVEFIKHIKGFLTTLVAFSQTAPLSHEIYTLYFMYLSLLYQLQLGFAHHEDAFNELLEFIIYV